MAGRVRIAPRTGEGTTVLEWLGRIAPIVFRRRLPPDPLRAHPSPPRSRCARGRCGRSRLVDSGRQAQGVLQTPHGSPVASGRPARCSTRGGSRWARWCSWPAGRVVRRSFSLDCGPQRVLAAPALPEPPGAVLPGRPAKSATPTRSPGSTATTTCPSTDAQTGDRRPALSHLQRRAQSGRRQEPGVAAAQGGVVRLHARLLRLRVSRRRAGRDQRRRTLQRATGARPAITPATHTSLTVGLAVATSGAAASPNMGYHTSPTLAFLMTVFNVRLGWWLRNPAMDATVWTGNAQRLSLRELL